MTNRNRNILRLWVLEKEKSVRKPNGYLSNSDQKHVIFGDKEEMIGPPTAPETAFRDLREM